jgi:hypothetical protein
MLRGSLLLCIMLSVGCTDAMARGFESFIGRGAPGFAGGNGRSPSGSGGPGPSFYPSGVDGGGGGAPTEPPSTNLTARWHTGSGLFTDTGCTTAVSGSGDDQQAVNCWRDTENSYDLVYTASLIPPKYLHNALDGGVHGLYCNGGGMLEGTTVTALADNATEFSVVVIYESAANDIEAPGTDNSPEDDQVFFYYDDGADTDYIWLYGGRRATPNTSKPRAIVNGNGAGDTSNLPTTDTDGGSVYYIQLNVDFSLGSNEQTLIVNNSETDQVSNAATDIGTGYDTLSVCNRLSGNAGAFQGVLFEVLVYDAFMSSGDQTTLVSYINNTYGTSY